MNVGVEPLCAHVLSAEADGLAHKLEGLLNALQFFKTVRYSELAVAGFLKGSARMNAVAARYIQNAGMFVRVGTVDCRITGGAGQEFEEQRTLVCENIFECQVKIERCIAAGTVCKPWAKLALKPAFDLVRFSVVPAVDASDLILDMVVKQMTRNFLTKQRRAETGVSGFLHERV